MEWKLFANLAEVAGGREVTVEGTPETVGDALEALLAAHPELEGEVLDGDGDLAGHITVLLNGRNVREADGLDTAVDEGDELALFPPVSGG